MKAFTLSAILIFSPIGSERVVAATLLLDDFSSGSFSLASGGTTSNSSAFTSPLTDQRTISGVSLSSTSWAVTLAPEELYYTVQQQLPLSRRSQMTISYTKGTGTFSILGYEAFAFDLSNVIGTGELIVSVSGSGGRDTVVPISASGTIVSPFSFLDTSQSLDSISSMNFRFIAVSQDFSLAVDNVRIVPEPSSLLLTGIAATSLLLRRRRK